MCAFTPATIPASTFNGGTITTPLAISPTDDGTISLDVGAPADMGASVFKCRIRGSQTLLDVGNLGGITTTKYSLDLSVARSRLTVGTGTVELDAFDVAGNQSQVLLVTQGRANFYDADSNIEVAALPAGLLIAGSHAAPADGALVAGDIVLWFDQTNGVGATKLMAKCKSADGTVKTATVATLT
jgi:hypothetical protein